VLLQMEKFGYLDGKIKLEVTPSDNTEDVKIIEKTAIDAAVLLKNEGGALPLKAADLKNLAMIGPGAGQIVAVGLTGEKAVGLPALEVGPLAAQKKIAAESAPWPTIWMVRRSRGNFFRTLASRGWSGGFGTRTLSRSMGRSTLRTLLGTRCRRTRALCGRER
jgi:beta-glucosidase-like glycosyl hydrolase